MEIRAIPPAVRRILCRARRSAVEALGGTIPSPAPGGLPVGVAARLLFPGCSERVPPQLLQSVAPDGFVHSLTQVRRLLGASDAQNFPSPVAVRFGRRTWPSVTSAGSVSSSTSDAGISAHLLTHGAWHPHVTRVFEQHVEPGMNVLDVGANVGWFSMLAAALTGPSGKVVAVEPSSENCRLVLASARANGFGHVEVWPFALDRERGWAQFIGHIGSNGGLIPPYPGELAERAAPIVPTFRLDDLVGDSERIDLVKIDVEGAEYRVVLGGQQTFERCRPVVVSELSLEMCKRISGAEPAELLRWFTSRGWTLNVIDGDDGSLHPFATPEDLLGWWPAHLHGEDLLFLPEY